MDVFSVVFLYCLWMLKPSLGENCSEHTCKLILHRKDLPVEFLSLCSEDGVRMVYLHLNISKGSYNQLQSYDKFLPSRWTWARDIGEPMLSFSYQYEVLSLGLLRNQVRNLEVVLNEEPQGCYAELTWSCKDTAVARTLLGKVINPSDSPLHSTNVVCVSVVQREMN